MAERNATPLSAHPARGWLNASLRKHLAPNSREFRFALSSEGRRVLHEDLLKAKELIVRDVDLDDGAYQGIARDLPSILDSLPFLRAH